MESEAKGLAQARRSLHRQGQGGRALHQEHGRRGVRLRREARLRSGSSLVLGSTAGSVMMQKRKC